MIVERSMHPDWLSNTYLVGSQSGDTAFFIDAGGPVERLIIKAKELDLNPTHVLLTHRHFDHVAELDVIKKEWPDIEVKINPDEAGGMEGETSRLQPNETFEIGGLTIKTLHTPGHTSGMISLLVNDSDVFTGDTLFKGSVGGVRAPGHTTFEDLKHSIMNVLLALPPETVIRPGHTDPTTVGEELDNNPFVRIWRGLDQEGTDPCVALEAPATLILLADDYDGGHKAWVRWEDGSDDIVPGSKVQRS